MRRLLLLLLLLLLSPSVSSCAIEPNPTPATPSEGAGGFGYDAATVWDVAAEDVFVGGGDTGADEVVAADEGPAPDAAEPEPIEEVVLEDTTLRACDRTSRSPSAS